MTSGSTLSTIISIFLLLLIGYGAKKVGLLKAKDGSVLTAVVLNLTLPAFIFTSVHGREVAREMIAAPFIFFGVEVVVMGLAYLVARAMRLDRPTTGGLILISGFGNTSFLGYPIVSLAFPDEKNAIVAAVIMSEFAMQTGLATVGVAIASSFSGAKFRWTDLLGAAKTPIFLAVVLGLLMRHVPLPGVVDTVLAQLSAATIPLAMIIIGLGFSTQMIREFPFALGVGTVLKLIAMPVLMFLAFRMTGASGVAPAVAVMLAAMPSSVASGVVAARYHNNGPFAAGAIALSTMASILCLPFVLQASGG